MRDDLSAVVIFSDGSTPLSIWLEIDSAGKMWQGTYVELIQQKGHKGDIALNALANYHSLLRNLVEFDEDRWCKICDGQGWTPVSCAALSWCKETSLEEVLGFWRKLGAYPAVKVAHDFPSLLFNPKLLPSNVLSDIIRAGKDEMGISVILASKLDPVNVDISNDKLALLPPRLKEMISARAGPIR